MPDHCEWCEDFRQGDEIRVLEVVAAGSAVVVPGRRLAHVSVHLRHDEPLHSTVSGAPVVRADDHFEMEAEPVFQPETVEPGDVG